MIQHQQGSEYHLNKEQHTKATREASRTQDGLMPAGSVLQGIWVKPPESETSSGIVGMRAHTDTDLYICVASNTWKKAKLELW